MAKVKKTDTRRQQPDSDSKEGRIAVPTPRQIVSAFDRKVIGQDAAKRSMAVAVRNHFRRLSLGGGAEMGKSNLLLVGPSGSGKTYMVENLLKQFRGIPYVIADASQLTAAGYWGQSVEELLRTLVRNAGGSIARAECGVLVLDEIDKVAAHSVNRGVDIGGVAVQEELLKLLEGKRWHRESRAPLEPNFSIRTDQILVIAMGAFEGLAEIVNCRSGVAGQFGFNRKHSQASTDATFWTERLLAEDLIRYGLMREFVGRFPILCGTNELSREDHINIFRNAEGGVLQQYRRLLGIEGVELEFTDSAVEKMADMAASNGTGARGLRVLAEKILSRIMYDPQAYRPHVRVNREFVEDQLPTLECGIREG